MAAEDSPRREGRRHKRRRHRSRRGRSFQLFSSPFNVVFNGLQRLVRCIRKERVSPLNQVGKAAAHSLSASHRCGALPGRAAAAVIVREGAGAAGPASERDEKRSKFTS